MSQTNNPAQPLLKDSRNIVKPDHTILHVQPATQQLANSIECSNCIRVAAIIVSVVLAIIAIILIIKHSS